MDPQNTNPVPSSTPSTPPVQPTPEPTPAPVPEVPAAPAAPVMPAPPVAEPAPALVTQPTAPTMAPQPAPAPTMTVPPMSQAPMPAGAPMPVKAKSKLPMMVGMLVAVVAIAAGGFLAYQTFFNDTSIAASQSDKYVEAVVSGNLKVVKELSSNTVDVSESEFKEIAKEFEDNLDGKPKRLGQVVSTKGKVQRAMVSYELNFKNPKATHYIANLLTKVKGKWLVSGSDSSEDKAIEATKTNLDAYDDYNFKE